MSPVNISKQGEFKPGWGQNHPKQIKKLGSQMRPEEKTYLLYLIRETDKIILHPHLQWKRDTGQISFDIMTIYRMFRAKRLAYHLKEFSRIELDDGTIDHRVLIRSNRIELVDIDGHGTQKCNLMFVLSLDTKEVVTAYYVHFRNHFDMPNMARYDAGLDIIATMQGSDRVCRPLQEERPYFDDLSVHDWLTLFQTADPEPDAPPFN